MPLRAAMTRIITISATLLVLLAVVFGLGQAGLFEKVFTPGPLAPVDVAKLERRAAPNDYLVAPDGFTPGKSDGEAPVLGVSAGKLKENWDAMMARQSGIEKVSESPDGLQIDYIQRSKLLRMPDRITVRFIPMPSDPETGNYATLAVYSRSVYGIGGMDAHRARVTAWLNGL